MSYQQTWIKLIWHLWTTITQIKGGWGRDLREFEDKEAQKPNHLYAHVREKHCLAKISSSGPNPQTSHDYDTCQASHPPRLLWRQLFPNPWMLRWRLSHPPILLSRLWSLGWDLAVSNVGQLKIPQRWKQREGNLQHHPPVRAKIGRNQMAPHRKLPSAGSLSKKIK